MVLGDFTQQAEAYQKSRPGYPDSLLDLLISDAGLLSTEIDQSPQREIGTSILNPTLIARKEIGEFGAGTGILTRMLIQRGLIVTAVEPNESMRKQANLPEATWISGTFEDSGLESGSQDWAVAAQAFHWADPQRCLPEIRRILRPGCLFTVMWNNRAPVDGDVVDWTQRTLQRIVPEFDEAYRGKNNPAVLESTGDFTFFKQRSALHMIEMSRARYLDLWKSHNRLNTLAGTDRFSRFYQELVAYLDQLQIKQVAVQYNCETWSARRNDVRVTRISEASCQL